MQADMIIDADRDTAVAPFTTYLQSENDVLRSSAVRALPALGSDARGDVRSILLDALIDPDPDVRCDAMEVLVDIALPEDAEIIRRSLEGDPVREVKLAAISALVRLRDPDAIELLRALSLSRIEDRVAWEDENSDWEEWLDIQTASITALGDMNVVDAIDDIRAAMDDEFGQALDVIAYGALARMGSPGVASLIEIFGDATGVARRRAAEALTRADPDSLKDHISIFLTAEEPELRCLALSVMSPDDARCTSLAKADPDPGVRSLALRHAAPTQPDLVREALLDSDDAVRAVAVAHLSAPFSVEFRRTLVDNMLNWLERSKPLLAVEVVRILPTIDAERALDPLLAAIDNTDHALEVRIAAAKALGTPELSVPSATLIEQLNNPARQVRATFLTVLCQRAAAGDEAAVDAAVSAISGELIDASDVPKEIPLDNAGPDLATPKEGVGPRKIWITPEGDIVERDKVSHESQQTVSTLQSILSDEDSVQVPDLAEETPEESGGKRAKRRDVEGSGDLLQSLTCDALRIFGDIDDARLTDAMISRVSDNEATIRGLVWQTLATRTVPESFMGVAEVAFRDDDPVIRMSALRLLSPNLTSDLLTAALTDADALIRAEAVASLSGDAALGFLGDPSSVVREQVARMIVDSGEDRIISRAVDRVILAERSDTMATLAYLSPSAKARALVTLSDKAGTDRAALVILRGLEDCARRV